jgi:hypothetical protein
VRDGFGTVRIGLLGRFPRLGRVGSSNERSVIEAEKPAFAGALRELSERGSQDSNLESPVLETSSPRYKHGQFAARLGADTRPRDGFVTVRPRFSEF